MKKDKCQLPDGLYLLWGGDLLPISNDRELVLDVIAKFADECVARVPKESQAEA